MLWDEAPERYERAGSRSLIQPARYAVARHEPCKEQSVALHITVTSHLNNIWSTKNVCPHKGLRMSFINLSLI